MCFGPSFSVRSRHRKFALDSSIDYEGAAKHQHENQQRRALLVFPVVFSYIASVMKDMRIESRMGDFVIFFANCCTIAKCLNGSNMKPPDPRI